MDDTDDLRVQTRTRIGLRLAHRAPPRARHRQRFGALIRGASNTRAQRLSPSAHHHGGAHEAPQAPRLVLAGLSASSQHIGPRTACHLSWRWSTERLSPRTCQSAPPHEYHLGRRRGRCACAAHTARRVCAALRPRGYAHHRARGHACGPVRAGQQPAWHSGTNQHLSRRYFGGQHA